MLLPPSTSSLPISFSSLADSLSALSRTARGGPPVLGGELVGDQHRPFPEARHDLLREELHRVAHLRVLEPADPEPAADVLLADVAVDLLDPADLALRRAQD